MEKLIKQQVNGNKARRDFKQLPLLWVRKENNNKRSPQLGNQSSVSYQEEEDRRRGSDGKQRKRELQLFLLFFLVTELEYENTKLNKNVDLKDIYDCCADIISTGDNVSAIM